MIFDKYQVSKPESANPGNRRQLENVRCGEGDPDLLGHRYGHYIYASYFPLIFINFEFQLFFWRNFLFLKTKILMQAFFTGFWTTPTNGFGGFLSLEKKSLSLGENSLSLGGKIWSFIGKLSIFALKLYKNCRIFEFRFKICLSLEKILEFRKKSWV